MWLDPRVIEWPMVRITSEYRDDDRAALEASIGQIGQKSAITVYRLADGRYVGADGRNRCERAVRAGDTLIECRVLDGAGEDEVLVDNVATALNRGHTNPMSVVQTLKALADGGRDLAFIAAAAGRGVEWVERMLAIADSSPAVQDALRDGLIAQGHAELLAGLVAHEDQERWLHRQLAHRWTVQELRDQIDGDGQEERQPPPPKERVSFEADTGRQCSACKAERDAADMQSMRLCPDCAAGLAGGRSGAAASDAGDRRKIERLRNDLDALREASAVLAQAPGTAHLAERIDAMVELLLEEREGDSPEPERVPELPPVGSPPPLPVQTRARPAVEPGEPPPPEGEPSPTSAAEAKRLEAVRQREEARRRGEEDAHR